MDLSYEEKKSFIIGMLLGDGSSRLGKNATNYNITCVHNPKQYEYLMWKMDILGKNLNRNYWISEKKSRFTGKAKFPGNENKTYKMYVAMLGSHTLVTKIRGEMYQKNIKKAPKEILEQLTPLGIAIWYMDDGNLAYKKNKNGSIRSREITLHIQGFDPESQENILNFFKDIYNIDCKLHKARDKYKLWMNTKNSIKFLKIIYPYVKMVDCMRYKTDLKYKDPNKQAKLFSE